MSARIVSVSVWFVAGLALPALVEAQQEEYVTKTEFENWKQDSFETLNKRVDDIDSQVNSLVPLKDELSEVQSRATNLEGDVNSLIDVTNNQTAALRDVAKQVSQGETDKWIPDIRKAMQNTEFQQDLTQAVHDSMLRRGTLSIDNKTTVGHTLRINDNHYVYVPAGRSHVVYDLPVGTISAELVGYERPRNWTLGPPNYEQRINIVPNSATRVFVARPPTDNPRVYVSPPAFVDAPIIVGPPVVIGPPRSYY